MSFHWVDEGIRPDGPLRIYRNGELRVTVDNGGTVYVHSGSVFVDQGVTIHHGDLTVEEGDVTIEQGNLTVSQGNVEVSLGDLTVQGSFGCNGKSPQPPFYVGDPASGPEDAVELVNNIRDALIAMGICS